MTPEMKERVLATVNELIDCCEGEEFHTDSCTFNDGYDDEEYPEYEDSDTARWKDQDRGLDND